MTATIKDQIGEIDRELSMRKSVYPRMVKQKKMSQEKADRVTARLQDARTSLVQLQQYGAITKTTFVSDDPLPESIEVEFNGAVHKFVRA